jgi:hypothetical protein
LEVPLLNKDAFALRESGKPRLRFLWSMMVRKMASEGGWIQNDGYIYPTASLSHPDANKKAGA